MIVDTMSWEEVTSYYRKLKKTFEANPKFLRTLKSFRPDRFRKAEDGIIFNGLKKLELENNDTLYISLFLYSNTLESMFQFFCKFLYRRKEYIVYFLSDGDVVFFSFHSISRYLERYYKFVDKSLPISVYDIAKMLAWNGGLSYKICDDNNILGSCRDGFFFGNNRNKCLIFNTFVTKEMLYPDQKVVDAELMSLLRWKFKLEFHQDI